VEPSLLRQRSEANVAVAERRTRDAVATDRVAPLPERAHLVQMLLPLGAVNAQADGAAVFEGIKRELTERFGGITAYTRTQAEGRWAGAHGTEREEIVVFEVLCGELDMPWWRNYRERLERQLREQTTVMRAEPVQLL
jgi:hypothetical protein